MTLQEWRGILQRTFDDVLRNHTQAFAAGMSYNFLMGLFPALIALAAVVAFLPVPNLFQEILNVMDLLGEVQELQFAALVPDRGVSTNELADAGAVDVGYVAQVEQDLFDALSDRITDGVAEHDTSFTESDATTQIDDGDAIDLTRASFHRHWEASLPSRESPDSFLIKVISVPGSMYQVLRRCLPGGRGSREAHYPGLVDGEGG